LISWDDKYLVGIDKFDAQHRNFFHILDNLCRDREMGESAVINCIDGLLSYVTEHFHDEESLMLAHGYPGYEDHIREHAKLLAKTQLLYSDMDAGNTASVEQVREMLINWIQEHIVVMDQQYVPFFVGKRVAFKL